MIYNTRRSKKSAQDVSYFLLTPYYSMNNDAQTFTTTANRNRVKILIE